MVRNEGERLKQMIVCTPRQEYARASNLDKALMLLGPQQVLYCKGLISVENIKGFEGVGISCGGDTTANIICLGDRELIVNGSNAIVTERLEAKNYIVHNPDLGEFAKGMGGPNCLIMPVERGA